MPPELVGRSWDALLTTALVRLPKTVLLGEMGPALTGAVEPDVGVNTVAAVAMPAAGPPMMVLPTTLAALPMNPSKLTTHLLCG